MKVFLLCHMQYIYKSVQSHLVTGIFIQESRVFSAGGVKSIETPELWRIFLSECPHRVTAGYRCSRGLGYRRFHPFPLLGSQGPSMLGVREKLVITPGSHVLFMMMVVVPARSRTQGEVSVQGSSRNLDPDAEILTARSRETNVSPSRSFSKQRQIRRQKIASHHCKPPAYQSQFGHAVEQVYKY